jgi:hypothetical protein
LIGTQRNGSGQMSEYSNRTICVDKHEIVVDRVHEIDIFTWQGNVIRIDGLPDEWEYTVHDLEVEDE